MGLDSDETHREVLRASVLAAQLPRDSRTIVAMAPAAQNGTVEHLLRQIELNQRLWHWAHTKSGQHGTSRPERMPLPGEGEQHEMNVRREGRRQGMVADALGLS